MAFSKNVVILQGEHSCTKFQNPLFQNAKEKYFPGEKVLLMADEGWGNALLLPSPTVCDGPPYLEGIGLFFR